MCHEMHTSVKNYLPSEDIKNYLVQIFEKTENEKQILDNECRKAQDILHFYFTRKNMIEINQNTLKCAENCATPVEPSESEKEIVSKIDTAIRHAKDIMKEVEKEMKNPKKFVKKEGTLAVLKDRKLCNKKESLDKSEEHDNRKPLSLKSEKIKKPGRDSVKSKAVVKDSVRQISSDVKRRSGNTAKGGGQFITTYKKDFISKNKQVKNVGMKCAAQVPLVSKNNINNVESIKFNDIDDLLERVTLHPSVVPGLYDDKCDSDRLLKSNTISKVLNNSSSLLSERASSMWESSGDQMKVFGLYCELISLVKNNRKRQVYSSNFLLKLKERNNSLISSAEKSIEKYESSMKMVSKCSTSRRNCTSSFISNFEDILRMIYSDDLMLLQVEFKISACDEKCFQLELLNMLKKHLYKPNQKNFCSTLFYKTCDSLLNISSK